MDIVFLGITVLFFGITIVLVSGCEKLRRPS